MSSHRNLRMAQAIREVVSSAILFEVSDPRVRGITVLRVEVSGDLRNATIFVSIMGTEAEQQVAMRGLKHAGGFLQARVASRLQTRFTPILSFKYDESVKKSVEMSRLIDDAVASDKRSEPASSPLLQSDTEDEDQTHVPDDVERNADEVAQETPRLEDAGPPSRTL
ncbi:MAG: 30S ribosome-binding factor RbfA [Isosphaeraceae bacterium]